MVKRFDREYLNTRGILNAQVARGYRRGNWQLRLRNGAHPHRRGCYCTRRGYDSRQGIGSHAQLAGGTGSAPVWQSGSPTSTRSNSKKGRGNRIAPLNFPGRLC